jgi:uncharacterized protein (TIGR03643 family)
MKQERKAINKVDPDPVIRMAWEDRCSFETIEERTGLAEADVIRIMRRELKPSSFRRWRARVSGRGTKHRKRFRQERQSIRPTSGNQPGRDI